MRKHIFGRGCAVGNAGLTTWLRKEKRSPERRVVRVVKLLIALTPYTHKIIMNCRDKRDHKARLPAVARVLLFSHIRFNATK